MVVYSFTIHEAVLKKVECGVVVGLFQLILVKLLIVFVCLFVFIIIRQDATLGILLHS